MKKVIMSESAYLNEHAHLIKLLNSSRRRDLKKEAKAQQKEVNDYLRKKR